MASESGASSSIDVKSILEGLVEQADVAESLIYSFLGSAEFNKDAVVQCMRNFVCYLVEMQLTTRERLKFSKATADSLLLEFKTRILTFAQTLRWDAAALTDLETALDKEIEIVIHVKSYIKAKNAQIVWDSFSTSTPAAASSPPSFGFKNRFFKFVGISSSTSRSHAEKLSSTSMRPPSEISSVTMHKRLQLQLLLAKSESALEVAKDSLRAHYRKYDPAILLQHNEFGDHVEAKIFSNKTPSQLLREFEELSDDSKLEHVNGELRQRFGMIRSIQEEFFKEDQLVATIARLCQLKQNDEEESGIIEFESLSQTYNFLSREGRGGEFVTFVIDDYGIQNKLEMRVLLETFAALLEDKARITHSYPSTPQLPTMSSR
jgi:hypothetical protein